MTITQNTWFSEFHDITSCEINGRPCAKVIRIKTSVQVVEYY